VYIHFQEYNGNKYGHTGDLTKQRELLSIELSTQNMTIKGVIETIQILPLLENGEGNNDKMYK
jgi:hypothetical protein